MPNIDFFAAHFVFRNLRVVTLFCVCNDTLIVEQEREQNCAHFYFMSTPIQHERLKGNTNHTRSWTTPPTLLFQLKMGLPMHRCYFTSICLGPCILYVRSTMVAELKFEKGSSFENIPSLHFRMLGLLEIEKRGAPFLCTKYYQVTHHFQTHGYGF